MSPSCCGRMWVIVLSKCDFYIDQNCLDYDFGWNKTAINATLEYLLLSAIDGVKKNYSDYCSYYYSSKLSFTPKQESILYISHPWKIQCGSEVSPATQIFAAPPSLDISPFSTCLPLQLCTLASDLHWRLFPFHKEKICGDCFERKSWNGEKRR